MFHYVNMLVIMLTYDLISCLNMQDNYMYMHVTNVLRKSVLAWVLLPNAGPNLQFLT